MISDLNTYLHKAVPDTRLTIKKYLDAKFEYLVSTLNYMALMSLCKRYVIHFRTNLMMQLSLIYRLISITVKPLI